MVLLAAFYENAMNVRPYQRADLRRGTVPRVFLAISLACRVAAASMATRHAFHTQSVFSERGCTHLVRRRGA